MSGGAARVLRILATVLLCVLGAQLVIGRLAASMLYPAPNFPVPEMPPPPVEDLRAHTENGVEISAWRLESPGGPEVLLLHGNGENLGTVWATGLMERFAALGVSVTVLDYPGYGRSTGRPSEASLVAGTSAVLARVRALSGDRPIALVGFSLGAAVAVQTAARRPGELAALVLISPWRDLAALASSKFPAWLVRWSLPDRWDSAAALRSLPEEVPVSILHGDRDRIIPTRHGRRLHAERASSSFVEIAGYGHNDLFGSPQLWEELEAILAPLVRDAPDPSRAGRPPLSSEEGSRR